MDIKLNGSRKKSESRKKREQRRREVGREREKQRERGTEGDHELCFLIVKFCILTERRNDTIL